jgi:hypothetical protein
MRRRKTTEAVKFGTSAQPSKKRSIKMNSEAAEVMISRSNLESLLHDGWLQSMGYDVSTDAEIKLDIPEQIKMTVKAKEVLH